MFRKLPDPACATVAVTVDGQAMRVATHETAASAALLAAMGATRTSPVNGEPRAPFCMMGVCYDCLMVIDGVPSRQACLVPVRDGMRIERQAGARALAFGSAETADV
ncbi:2Fe-2S iron-sulfur cluster protein [Stella humosa]|uniref:2Fe-2S iron-sulfur cluster protein n=1 Tax=Stella humosa TaxID=94 RepID=A0A3N1M8D1_9PROT|nr:(2Fe-2S)-binding protein [Stella humosa]ROP99957.1 2Fe-2S iron-sulfur cluster protein [Stella humosa]BBK30812.1 (2Fe-2S)-binding protein [Stella humosa]